MMTTPSGQQQQPYLPTSRQFPVNNLPILEPELVKSYIEIAQAVNGRTIGVFENIQIVTGERWYASDPTNALNKRQTYRKAFPVGAIAKNTTLQIPHGITGIVAFTRIYGTCITDLPDFRPIPYASIAGMTATIDLRVDTTTIYIAVGSGSPNVLSGNIVLEYLLN
jgi:hypothetical protein